MADCQPPRDGPVIDRGGDDMTADTASRDAPGTVPESRPAATLVELAPLALVILAEAAWLSALAELIQGLSARPSVIAIVPFAVFVAGGALAARLLSRRLDHRWPLVVPGLVAIAAVAGTIYSEDARAAVRAGLGPVMSAHPAGWLAGVAVLRGVALARLPVPEDSIARLLGVGLPGLALIAIAGAAVTTPYRAAF